MRGRLGFLSLSIVMLTCAIVQAAAPASAAAQPPDEQEIRELIVLISPRAASDTPRIVVDAINQGTPVPLALGVGNPQSARLAIPERARGRMAEWIRHNPDTPEGRLQRYIVVRYPAAADRGAAFENLSRNPFVQHVEENLAFKMHGLPSDPYVGTGIENPGEAQWGVHALNFPAAWELTKGHALIGFIDEGLEVGHPELRASHDVAGVPVFDGGGFRAHLSRDVLNKNCSVDELDPDDDPSLQDESPGHGTHVTGIAAARIDNATGVAGACNCSVAMVKASANENGTNEMFFDTAADGLTFLTTRGAQAVNMSFGVNYNLLRCEGSSALDLTLFCDATAVADLRAIVMVASAGNDMALKVDYPARDPRTIAVGGLELDPVEGPVLWRREACPLPPSTIECGSSTGPSMDLMTPAEDVLATAYRGFDHELTFTCGDSLFPVEQGYGLCSGSSMSAAFVTGLAGNVCSANPLLDKEDVRDVLTSTASIPGAKDPLLGHGIPDAGAAVSRALGEVAGVTLKNRLTPLFSFESLAPGQARTRTFTTAPQTASALLLDDVRGFDTVGPLAGSYGAFPQFCTNSLLVDCCPLGQPCCVGQGSECVAKILVDSSTRPRASVFIFTTENAPTPVAPPLVPLYRLRYESALTAGCESPPTDPVSPVRDFAFATSEAEVEAFLQGVSLGGNVFKYKVDRVEGYVFEHCNGGCPGNAVALHRLYHAGRHDMVVVPATEVAAMQVQGYFPPGDPSLPEIVGYAYPNVDSDSDGLVDGFEAILSTNPALADTDGDGVSDGDEILVYDRSNPDPALHGYRDPCSDGCPLFADGFEAGNTSNWTITVP